jgi:hypothetical protein
MVAVVGVCVFVVRIGCCFEGRGCGGRGQGRVVWWEVH